LQAGALRQAHASAGPHGDLDHAGTGRHVVRLERPEGNPPPPEVTIPRIEGATSDEWTDWHWYTTIVQSNCREIIDNVVDMAHFFYIHGALPTYFKNIFEGHVATQYMNGEGRPDMGGTEGAEMLGNTSVASYYGRLSWSTT